MEFTEISTNDYPLFHDLLNDYYREGEDEGTEQEVIDSFIKLLFDLVEVIDSAKGSNDRAKSETGKSADTELGTEVSE